MYRNIRANGFGAICYDVLAVGTTRTRSPGGAELPSLVSLTIQYSNCGGTRFVSHRKSPSRVGVCDCPAYHPLHCCADTIPYPKAFLEACPLFSCQCFPTIYYDQ